MSVVATKMCNQSLLDAMHATDCQNVQQRAGDAPRYLADTSDAGKRLDWDARTIWHRYAPKHGDGSRPNMSNPNGLDAALV